MYFTEILFECRDADIPAEDAGFVCLAFGVNDLAIQKLGHCINIRKEMKMLNQSLNSKNNHCRPWILALFITLFDGDGRSDK